MTSTELDDLLKDASLRDVVLKALQALTEGGAVITANIVDPAQRSRMERALEEFGARLSKRGHWKKKDSKDDNKRLRQYMEGNVESSERAADSKVTMGPSLVRPVFGVAMPPSAMTEAKHDVSPGPYKSLKENDDDDDDDLGPLPASAAPRRPQPNQSVSSSSSSAIAKPKREDWMSQDLKELDPTRAMKLQAMTSQTGRSFNNFKTTSTGGVELPGADSRAAATGKPIAGPIVPQLAPKEESKGFRWNHEEMMGEEKVDKNRLNKSISEGINARFTSASGKYL